jgi:protein-S-isoprenylcysteine O-methyltransferase Ste14
MTLALRVFLATLILPCSALLWIPWLGFLGSETYRSHWPPALADIPALALVAIGVAIYLMCAWRFATEGRGTPAPWDAPRRVVTGGLYRWTRNPMYIGVVIALLGEAWWLGSLSMLAYAAAILVIFHLRVVMHEEPVMYRIFGANFEAYRTRVRRWGLF